MGFHGINEENRQYVCLSQSANSILENDMLAFQITNRSTIINIIIDNYIDEVMLGMESISKYILFDKISR